MSDASNDPAEQVVCISCGGTGTGDVVNLHHDEDGDVDDVEVEAGPCPECEGLGYAL